MDADQRSPLEVGLRPWRDDDLDLLRGLVGDPATMVHLGGPETEAQVRSRHERYRAAAAGSPPRAFAITVAPAARRDGAAVGLSVGDDAAEPIGVGWVGYWETDEDGETTWETGWSVLPAWQGRGVASRGAAMALELAAAERRHQYIQAVSAVSNLPSNRLCERLGFELVATADLEYPKGTWKPSHVWRRALW